LNGDIIEGVHHKTTQIISADVGDHIKCAKEVLRPVTKRAKKIFMVKGTECHTGTSENFIAEGLGAEENTAEGTHSWDRLTIDVNGVRCVWRHHIGTSVRRSLAATQLSATLAEEQVEAANAGEPIPRVVCCAHRHKFGYYEDNNGLCVVSPPWQGLSRFGHKVVSQARTNPGVFALDFRGKNRGELPELHSRVYESQRTQAVEL
jgi:hypothetical protein